jgi:large subunit ribosomal protein L4
MIVVSDEVFGVEPNLQSVRAAVNNYLANQRRGTHATKTRGRVSGGGRKPWKQKHTGRARQGSIRAPQWRGGAIIFGPHPRDYSYRISRTVRQSAFCSVLSELVRGGRLIVIDQWGFEQPKTRRVVEILKSLGVEGKVLIFTEPGQRELLLSARNIAGVSLASVESPNIYDLLIHDYVVASRSSVKKLEEALAA